MTLEIRRIRADLIKVFKIFEGSGRGRKEWGL